MSLHADPEIEGWGIFIIEAATDLASRSAVQKALADVVGAEITAAPTTSLRDWIATSVIVAARPAAPGA